ncbi:MAG: thioredoxin family protein [Prevotellaceae bacterium]|jgi:thioredoxin|nr:thioredoxin family protein [Prevotellaceae bacterium]
MKKTLVAIAISVIALFAAQNANGQVRTLTSDMFFSKIWDNDNETFINKNGIVIDFYATWCKPCHIMKPIFDNVANEYYNYHFYRVDIDEEESLSGMFGIDAIPTIIYIPHFNVNRTYYQSTGVIERKELIRNIKKYLKL